MSVRLFAQSFSGALADVLTHPAENLEWYWLGQAGFLLRGPNYTWLIDPYLSDRLADKYRGKPLSHVRMMPAPVAVSQLGRVDLVLCTHRHGDHLDQPTLENIAKQNPNARFVLPAGIRQEIAEVQLPRGNIFWAVPDQPLKHGPLTITALPSAHEIFGYDEAGHHKFVGYSCLFAGRSIYHSGDTVLYPGLTHRLRTVGPDVALLPVNGRRAELSAQGIAGNLSLEEAIALSVEAGIPNLLAHHFGLFAFNTIDPRLIDAASLTVADRLTLVRAELGKRYYLRNS
jgi:L-ascorbate metabolism protein UlaG (beta-lactamase superfamily)